MSGAHEPFDELAAAYALDALDGEDLTHFLAHLAEGCVVCERTVVQCQEGLARVAADLRATPPISVKQRIIAWVPSAAAQPDRRPRRAARRIVGFLAWAASLLLAAGLGAWATRQHLGEQYDARIQAMAAEANELRTQLGEQGRTLAGLREQVTEQEATLATLRQKVAGQEQAITLASAKAAEQERLLGLLRDPATRLVALDGLAPSPKSQGRMIWNPDAGGVLIALDLPPLPAGKAYELWAIAGKTPLPAGVFTVDAQGKGSIPVGPIEGRPVVTMFAVTLEPAGGVPSPTGPMYLASKSG